MAFIKENQTKIIATYGPSCESDEVFEAMIESGVDVFRFNFSHGDHDFHLRGFNKVMNFNRTHGTNVAVLADLQGPKIRVGEVQGGGIELHEGQKIRMTCESQISTNEVIYVSYNTLGKDVKIGEKILIDDGKMVVQVSKILDDKNIEVQVIEGGELLPKKGVNFPGTVTSVESMTEKDYKDLEFIKTHRANWIALSFVRTADDVKKLKSMFTTEELMYMKIISKIEKPEAVKNLDSIIDESDGIMVARGDLAIEVPFEKVPLLQKQIVINCNRKGKPVIVATQMMESMIEKSMPTRAEISDVANAVLDGADALMLSGETSVGKYPVKVIQTMSKIIEKTEKQSEIYYRQHYETKKTNPDYTSDAVCYSATTLVEVLGAKAIIGMTRSGYTGFRISSYRPKSKIYIFSDNKPLLYTLNLIWGVKGFYYEGLGGTDQSIEDVIQIVKEKKLVSKGDIVINTASMPLGDQAKTNTVKVSIVK